MDFKLPIKYFPLKKGDAELRLTPAGSFNLYYKGHGWMGLSPSNWQVKEQAIETSRAYGKCITTGLGIGAIQTLLLENPKVTEIVVFEKHSDVIEIFKEQAAKSFVDITRLKIINDDADNISGEVCDCMFLDHFETEYRIDVVERVRNISKKNKAKLLWYWPAAYHYFLHLDKNNLTISKESFTEYALSLDIDNFLVVLNERDLEILIELYSVYMEDYYSSQSRARQQLSLLSLKNKFKK